MCIKTNVPLHKTHAFERNAFYHKVDNILKDLVKLPERGGRGGGGRMGKVKKTVSKYCNITV